MLFGKEKGLQIVHLVTVSNILTIYTYKEGKYKIYSSYFWAVGL